MKSKNPELHLLAHAGLAAIRRWEEAKNETKETQETAPEDPDGDHVLRGARHVPGHERDGLAGSYGPDRHVPAGDGLARDLLYCKP